MSNEVARLDQVSRGQGAGALIIVAGLAGLAFLAFRGKDNGNGGGNGLTGFLSNPVAAVKAPPVNGLSSSITLTNNTSGQVAYTLQVTVQNSLGVTVTIPSARFGFLDPSQVVQQSIDVPFLPPLLVTPGENFNVHWQLFLRNTSTLLDELFLNVVSMAQDIQLGQCQQCGGPAALAFAPTGLFV